MPVHFCQPDVTKCTAFHRKRKIFGGAPTGNRSIDRDEALIYKEALNNETDRRIYHD